MARSVPSSPPHCPLSSSLPPLLLTAPSPSHCFLFSSLQAPSSQLCARVPLHITLPKPQCCPAHIRRLNPHKAFPMLFNPYWQNSALKECAETLWSTFCILLRARYSFPHSPLKLECPIQYSKCHAYVVSQSALLVYPHSQTTYNS